jgi:hypothetical protein
VFIIWRVLFLLPLTASLSLSLSLSLRSLFLSRFECEWVRFDFFFLPDEGGEREEVRGGGEGGGTCAKSLSDQVTGRW